MTQNDQMLLEKGAIDRLAQYKVATNLEFVKTHTHTHTHITVVIIYVNNLMKSLAVHTISA